MSWEAFALTLRFVTDRTNQYLYIMRRGTKYVSSSPCISLCHVVLWVDIGTSASRKPGVDVDASESSTLALMSGFLVVLCFSFVPRLTRRWRSVEEEEEQFICC